MRLWLLPHCGCSLALPTPRSDGSPSDLVPGLQTWLDLEAEGFGFVGQGQPGLFGLLHRGVGFGQLVAEADQLGVIAAGRGQLGIEAL